MKPFVTIIMPALNEEAHIGRAIQSILPQAEQYECELIVADGGSSDSTCKIVDSLGKQDPRIRRIGNPKRIQAAGFNLAARHANPLSEILIRADCHAEYPDEFVHLVCKPIIASAADAVVVPMNTQGKTSLQSAIAIAQNSRLGNGGSPHRRCSESCFVDHGHHAAIRKMSFLQIGGYREDMVANEDAEFDFRFTQTGHKIWLSQEAQIIYFPRKSYIGLARQYFRYGKGRARSCFLHRKWPKFRQFAPVFIATIVCLTFLGSLIEPAFLLVPALYVMVCQSYAIALAIKTRRIEALLSGSAAIVMHVAWGLGFLWQSLRELTKHKT